MDYFSSPEIEASFERTTAECLANNLWGSRLFDHVQHDGFPFQPHGEETSWSTFCSIQHSKDPVSFWLDYHDHLWAQKSSFSSCSAAKNWWEKLVFSSPSFSQISLLFCNRFLSSVLRISRKSAFQRRP